MRDNPYDRLRFWTIRVWNEIEALPWRLKRLWDWLPVIWRDNDFAFDSLLPIMAFKLKRLEATVQDGHLLNGPKYAKQIRVLRGHIDRYQNPPWCDADVVEFEWVNLGETPEGCCRMDIRKKFGSAIFSRAQFENIDPLEQWHWNQIWSIIAQRGQHWWD